MYQSMKEEVVLRWRKKAENDLEIQYPEEYIELRINEAMALYETAKEVKEFVVEVTGNE